MMAGFQKHSDTEKQTERDGGGAQERGDLDGSCIAFSDQSLTHIQETRKTSCLLTGNDKVLEKQLDHNVNGVIFRI